MGLGVAHGNKRNHPRRSFITMRLWASVFARKRTVWQARRPKQVRIALGWEKVPVLRNRRRALVVVESPLDSFGPALYSDNFQDQDPLASPFTPPSKFMRSWMRESDDRVRSK